MACLRQRAHRVGESLPGPSRQDSLDRPGRILAPSERDGPVQGPLAPAEAAQSLQGARRLFFLSLLSRFPDRAQGTITSKPAGTRSRKPRQYSGHASPGGGGWAFSWGAKPLSVVFPIPDPTPESGNADRQPSRIFRWRPPGGAIAWLTSILPADFPLRRANGPLFPSIRP